MDMKTDHPGQTKASVILNGLGELFPDTRITIGALMDALGEAG